MKLIICVSNNNGMMFNHRRLSRDSTLTQKILEITNNEGLTIYPYSEALFNNKEINVIDCPNPQLKGYVFVEEPNRIPKDIMFEEIVLCKWNRDYPADQFFALDMIPYELISKEEFAGNSHEKITIERYQKKGNKKK